MVALLFFAILLIPAALASGTGNHGGTVANNDYAPNDLGNTNKFRTHAAYSTLPTEERNYYEHGQSDFNHDGVGGHDNGAGGGTAGNGIKDGTEANHDRGDLASFCARYNRGAAPDGAMPASPTTVAQFNDFIEKVKKCVDDLLGPDKDPQVNIQKTVTDEDVVNFINVAALGIGNPMTAAEFTANGHGGRTGFVCINHARVFASLLRELGVPVRDVNVPLSKIRGGIHEYVYQEAAVEVWFDGGWHYFDAYLTNGEGTPDAETDPDGLLGGGITDRKVHFTSKGAPNYRFDRATGDPIPGSGWEKRTGSSNYNYEETAAAVTIEQTGEPVRMFAYRQSDGWTTGWTPALGGSPTIPDSLVGLFVDPALSGALLQLPASAYIPFGVEIPASGVSEDSLLNPAVATPETIVINDPTIDTYCLTVWDQAGTGSSFAVVVTTEGGATTNLPPTAAGHLSPGEERELVCTSAVAGVPTLSQWGLMIAAAVLLALGIVTVGRPR